MSPLLASFRRSSPFEGGSKFVMGVALVLIIISIISSPNRILVSAQQRNNGRYIQCFHCLWYPNSELPSARNAPEVCRPHAFKLPLVVESCELGCIVSILYTDGRSQSFHPPSNSNEAKRNKGSNILSYNKPASEISTTSSAPAKNRTKSKTFPLSIRREANSTYRLNVTLPPMKFFFRGCAKTYHTGCIMDMSRPGIFHEDCFCHSDMCNGQLLNDAVTVRKTTSIILHYVLIIVILIPVI